MTTTSSSSPTKHYADRRFCFGAHLFKIDTILGFQNFEIYKNKNEIQDSVRCPGVFKDKNNWFRGLVTGSRIPKSWK